VAPSLKPLDIVSWVKGDSTQVVMVVRVEDGRVWLTDGYSEVGHILGDSLFGDLSLVSGAETGLQKNRLMTLWQAHVWKRRV